MCFVTVTDPQSTREVGRYNILWVWDENHNSFEQSQNSNGGLIKNLTMNNFQMGVHWQKGCLIRKW